MKDNLSIELKIPKQDLMDLSIGISSPSEMAQWIESLPKLNIGENSRQLYRVIQELNRYQTDPKNRFLLLEAMRQPIYQACKSLSRYYLNQPIILNEKESQIAKLTQALQHHLAIGYKLVILDKLHPKKKSTYERKAAAIHRALSDLSGNLFRYYLLYEPVPKGLWKEIHQLYSLADHYKMLDKVIEDPATKTSMSIKHCYHRALLLSQANVNQLRQQEISQLSQAFNIWAEHCQIKTMDQVAEPFLVDLNSDEGVMDAQRYLDGRDAELTTLRYVSMSHLANIVQNRLDNPDDDEGLDFKIKVITKPVLRHLAQCWSKSAERGFNRTEYNGSLSLTIGLTTAHYYISGGQSELATNYITTHQDNIFLKQKGNRQYNIQDEIRSHGDIWSLQAITKLQSNSQTAVTKKSANIQKEMVDALSQKFARHTCNIVNTSPNGYCLTWNDKVPVELKVGEIVTTKEPEQNHWSIGIIRWVKRTSDTKATLGLKLLSPHAEALSAKIINKNGSASEPMHVIRLPELKALKQPSTLLTSALKFKTGDRVMLNINGKQTKLLLKEELCSTASFIQFNYKVLGHTTRHQVNENTSGAKGHDDDFNSLWTSI